MPGVSETAPRHPPSPADGKGTRGMAEGPSPDRVSRNQPPRDSVLSAHQQVPGMPLACSITATIPRASLGDVISHKLQHMTAHLEGVR